MTPAMVGALMKRARKLLQEKVIRRGDIATLDCMVFQCRGFGTRKTSISLRRLATLLGCCHDTVIEALRRLERAGFLRKDKRRVKVPWMGVMASRQATNVYEFLPPTESTISTVIREQASLPTVVPGDSPLERALKGLGSALSVDLPQRW